MCMASLLQFKSLKKYVLFLYVSGLNTHEDLLLYAILIYILMLEVRQIIFLSQGAKGFRIKCVFKQQ